MEGTFEDQGERVTVSRQELAEQVIGALHYFLIENDQAHFTPSSLHRGVRQRLAEIAGSQGVVTRVPERGSNKGSRPMRSHYDQHSRWIHCLPPQIEGAAPLDAALSSCF
jgi:hypothetical protein